MFGFTMLRVPSVAVCLLLGGVALGAGWMGGFGHKGGGGDAAPTALEVPSDAELEPVVVELESSPLALEIALRRTGLTPESLAAAGVGTSAFATLLSRADGWFLENGEALRGADVGLGSARGTRDSLQRKVRSGKASAPEVDALPPAKAAHGTALATRDGTLQDLFTSATGQLTTQQIATLAQIRANAHWKLPVPFLVEEREEAVWVPLRDALVNERSAPVYGEELGSWSQSYLATMRARQPVSQAIAATDTYLAALKASWQNSLSGSH